MLHPARASKPGSDVMSRDCTLCGCRVAPRGLTRGQSILSQLCSAHQDFAVSLVGETHRFLKGISTRECFLASSTHQRAHLPWPVATRRSDRCFRDNVVSLTSDPPRTLVGRGTHMGHPGFRPESHLQSPFGLDGHRHRPRGLWGRYPAKLMVHMPTSVF